ncbi:MAG: helix-turn-helix domain-containing protein [Nocardioides sp.]
MEKAPHAESHSLVIHRWTGAEARHLRMALRLSIEGFAEKLGISSRAVDKWEARGNTLTPRPDTQAMLDTVLSQANEGQRERFVRASADSVENNRDPINWHADDVGCSVDSSAIEAFRAADKQLGGGHLYGAVVSYLHVKVSPGLFGGESGNGRHSLPRPPP